MLRCLLLPLLLLPLLLRAQAIDGYQGIKWLSTPKQALAKLGAPSSTLRPLDPRQSTLGDLRGFDWLIEVERRIGGRVFAVQLFFMDGQLVTAQSYTPVLPGETFADAVAAVRGSLPASLKFEFESRHPTMQSAADAAGNIQLGSYQVKEAPSQVELSYYYVDFRRLEGAYLREWRRAKFVEDSLRQARVKAFERDYALSFGGDEAAPKELLHGRKTAPVVAPPAPEAVPAVPAAPKIRRPTPAQRRQQAARKAWWHRTLKLPKAKPTSLIFRPGGMIRSRPTFPARTSNRFA